MKGGQRFLNLVSPDWRSRPKGGPRAAHGTQKVGGSAPHIYIKIWKLKTLKMLEKTGTGKS